MNKELASSKMSIPQEDQVLPRSKEDAIFASKVPRIAGTSSGQVSQDSIEFPDQQRGTISKAQNDLTLKTVQKMFAGRKEAHNTMAANLVRINKIKQLQKDDPLVRDQRSTERRWADG